MPVPYAAVGIRLAFIALAIFIVSNLHRRAGNWQPCRLRITLAEARKCPPLKHGNAIGEAIAPSKL